MLVPENVTTLTHTITPSAQEYQWLMISPSFSAIITIPPSSGGQDAISIQNPGTPDQVLCIQPPAGSSAKPVQVTLMGVPSLLGAESMRQFQIRNATVPAGQMLKLKLREGGKVLHMENGGPAMTFDLSIQVANEHNVAVELQRSNVSLDTQQAISLAPQSWSPATFANTSIQLNRLEQLNGKVMDSKTI